MLELYQFELSAYCEKVRLALDYKSLDYRKIEVTPGVGQIDVFRMSGQRQVPVLKDGNEVIADSTAILRYLDRTYPDRPLTPTAPAEAALATLLEAWADDSFYADARKVFLATLGQDPGYRTALLPEETPDPLKTLVGFIPGELFGVMGAGVGLSSEVVTSAKAGLGRSLTSLCSLLESRPYLTGNQPSMADVAVAAISVLVKMPSTPYFAAPVGLRGRGIPGIADDPAYGRFFEWRDRFYSDFRTPLTGAAASTSGSSSGPTTISID
jgi:glutathione S-transferase